MASIQKTKDTRQPSKESSSTPPGGQNSNRYWGYLWTPQSKPIIKRSGTMSLSKASAGSAGGDQADPDATVVFWLDVAILGVLAVFTLSTLPRVLARFAAPYERLRGGFLRAGSDSITPSDANLNPPLEGTGDDSISPTSARSSFHSATLLNQSQTISQDEGNQSEKNSSGKRALPLHMPSISTLSHPLSSFFTYSVTPAKTVGQLILIFLYIGAIIFAVFYTNDPFSDANRLGAIAVSQIPVVFALSTKNNLPGLLTGLGYEKASATVKL